MLPWRRNNRSRLIKKKVLVTVGPSPGVDWVIHATPPFYNPLEIQFRWNHQCYPAFPRRGIRGPPAPQNPPSAREADTPVEKLNLQSLSEVRQAHPGALELDVVRDSLPEYDWEEDIYSSSSSTSPTNCRSPGFDTKHLTAPVWTIKVDFEPGDYFWQRNSWRIWRAHNGD